jgi:hypothetical protein
VSNTCSGVVNNKANVFLPVETGLSLRTSVLLEEDIELRMKGRGHVGWKGRHIDLVKEHIEMRIEGETLTVSRIGSLALSSESASRRIGVGDR